ncbi:MAG: hypothetical protein LR011_05360 [Verrucomicrobia bacterium]|nr:hypothetical protein [Verrucomicrobiota bacterium]
MRGIPLRPSTIGNEAGAGKYPAIGTGPENCRARISNLFTSLAPMAKAQVCAFLESIYRTAGYRTGLFTSPHLVHFNERIRISGVPVSREKSLNGPG